MSEKILNNEDNKKINKGLNELKEKVEKEEYSFIEELKEKMGLGELDNPTLYYQLTSFLDACNINLILEGGYINQSDEKSNFLIKEHSDNEISYHFEILKSRVLKNDAFLIKGQYNDLMFDLHCYYRLKKLNDDIKQIPFSLQLEKNINKNTYSMKIQTIKMGKTKFVLERQPDNNTDFSDQLVFYSNRSDFENAFSIIDGFVKNPEYVFLTYKAIMLQKHIVLNSSELKYIDKNPDLLITRKGKVLQKVLNNKNND